MKRILYFLSSKQFQKTMLRESDERYKLLTYFLVILISSFCIGYFLATYYDFNFIENIVRTDKFLLFVNTFFAINYLLLDFYPVYKVNPFLFPTFYPIKKYQKAVIVLIIYSINYYSLFVFLVYFQFALFSDYFSLIELIFSLLFVFCGYLINRIVKNLTEYEIKGNKLVLSILSIFLGGYIWCLVNYQTNTLLGIILVIIIFSILFVCFAHCEAEKRVKIKSHLIFFKTSKNYYWKLLFNSNLSTTYMYGFFFKVLWLLVAGLELLSENRPENLSAVTLQFASPLIVLLYTGLNFFGYNKNLLFTHLIREDNIKSLTVIYFKLIGILLLIDSIIFGLFITITGFVSWEILLFYLTSAIILTIMSFWFALYSPRFTDNFLFFDFSFLKNRSRDFNPWGVAALIIAAFSIDLIQYSNYMILISVISILIALSSLYFHRGSTSFISKYAYSKLNGA